MVKYFRSLLVLVQAHQNAAMLWVPVASATPPGTNLRYKLTQTIHSPSHIGRAIRPQVVLENESSVSKASSSPYRLELADLRSMNEKSEARSRSGSSPALRVLTLRSLQTRRHVHGLQIEILLSPPPALLVRGMQRDILAGLQVAEHDGVNGSIFWPTARTSRFTLSTG
jgi:hypothetical protein